MLQQKIAEIITKLKKVKEENGLSCQKIVDLVEQNGEYVSLSTVKRVFEDGSEAYGFQYDNTLKPIADAVLGIYSATDIVSANEVDALKAIVAYKSDRITDLEAQLERIEESFSRQVDFMKDQIAKKDDRIDKRDAMIEKLLDSLLELKRVGDAT